MKYISYDTYKFDEGEPALRSCWECNSAHQYLRETDFLHLCFVCGRYWIFGHYIDELENTDTLDAFLKEKLTPK